MRILLATSVDVWTRSVSTLHRYIAAGRKLGHEIALYGDPREDAPALLFTKDIGGVDIALFVVQVPADFPDMPYLAKVLDGIPRERRVVLDLWGRYNATIRLEHDYNHLEKVDGHPAWEWSEAMDAVSDRILQPTLSPLQAGVKTHLFHGFDAAMVARPYANAREAAAAWLGAGAAEKPYGFMYIGNNWHRWHQLRTFLEEMEPVRAKVGNGCLIGWDWWERPSWASENGIAGVDTNQAMLKRLDVEVRDGVPFDKVVGLLGMARFAPVIHRPLFRHLGLVTNRTFETFYADTMPILMLPAEFVSAIYGPAAVALVPSGSIAEHMSDATSRPEFYWDAVLQTRTYLARNHGFERRIQDLVAIVGGQKPGLAGGTQ
jgi:hypothetical protein